MSNIRTFLYRAGFISERGKEKERAKKRGGGGGKVDSLPFAIREEETSTERKE